MLEHAVNQPQLGAALLRFAERSLRLCAVERLQQGAAKLVVDGEAVVRIDQRVIPYLGALVDVGNAGASEQQRSLGQRVDSPPFDQAVHAEESLEVGDEISVAEHIDHEPLHGLVVVGLGIDPRSVNLGLLGRLCHECDRCARP